MRISLSSEALTKVTADLVAIGVRSTKIDADPSLAALAAAWGASALEAYLKEEGFEAKQGQTLRFPGRGKLKAASVLLVGLGEEKKAEASARSMGLALARAARRHKAGALVLPLPEEADAAGAAEAVRAASEGLVLGAYRYVEHKSKDKAPKGGLRSAVVLTGFAKNAAVKRAVADGKVVGESVNLARDLVNGPPNHITPIALARECERQAEAHGLHCEVWNKKRIEKEGMNLLLAVNRGSAVEPRFIHLAHKPRGAGKPKVVFVGKGLTFDAGGLCLKPAKSMVDMKCDMAGAAATLGIVVAAARLKLPVEVHAVIPSTENMTGAAAYRPGDVYTSREGKTVEIINTDAEGRLALADALSWAQGLQPDILIDHATLTGACMVALGPWTAGLFTADDELAERYRAAGEREGESFWRLPLHRPLRKSLESEVADLKHVGGAYGGAITAALFLEEFVGKTRWMHLDIAGPAFLDAPQGRAPKGGTGFGVSTAVRFLSDLAVDR